MSRRLWDRIGTAHTGQWGKLVERHCLDLYATDAAVWRRGSRPMIRFLAGAVVFGLVANAVFNTDAPDSSPANVGPHALEISADANGHFQSPCMFNGVSMRCLVDSGATGVMLDRRAATRIGIDVRRLRFSSRSETANGIARITCGVTVTLEVGPITHPEFPVCVIDSDMHGIPLLGMAFLRLHRVAMEDDTLTISE